MGSSFQQQVPSISCSLYATGRIFQTNLRIVFISDPRNESVVNLVVPLQNIKNGALSSSFFSGKTYTCTILPVPDQGISSLLIFCVDKMIGLVMPGKLTLNFSSGGFEFDAVIKQLSSRMNAGSAPTSSSGPAQLPEYSEPGIPEYDAPPPPLADDDAPPLYQ